MQITTQMRTDLKNAQAALKAAGWVHSHSIMVEKAEQASNCYGLVFTRHGFRFYLNFNTIGMVGDACQPTPVMGE